jgi:excisionase family DNA binding protein
MGVGLLRAREVAAMLGTTEKFVYQLARKQDLPSVRISRKCVRFDPSVVDKWVEDKRRGGCWDGNTKRHGKG